MLEVIPSGLCWIYLTMPSGSPITSLGKAPLGRDPKSRARSRDYLKQYVAVDRMSGCPLKLSKVPSRDFLLDVSSSYESVTQ